MKYINVEECISKIDPEKVNIYDYANVYVSADKNSMTLAFSYSDNMEDEFSILRITEDEMELTDELWKEFLAVSILIRDRFNVERIVDNVRFEEKLPEEFEKDVFNVANITVTYSLDRSQFLRVQRLSEELKMIGLNYSIEDTLQAVMTTSGVNDLDNNLRFYEELLSIEKG